MPFTTPPLRLFPIFGGPDVDEDGPQSKEDLRASVIGEVDENPELFSCNTDGIVYVNTGSWWLAPELEAGSEKVKQIRLELSGKRLDSDSSGQ